MDDYRHLCLSTKPFCNDDIKYQQWPLTHLWTYEKLPTIDELYFCFFCNIEQEEYGITNLFIFLRMYIQRLQTSGERHSNHIKTRIHHHFSFFHHCAYLCSIEQSYILLDIYNCILTVVSIFSFLLMFYSLSIGLFSIQWIFKNLPAISYNYRSGIYIYTDNVLCNNCLQSVRSMLYSKPSVCHINQIPIIVLFKQ